MKLLPMSTDYFYPCRPLHNLPPTKKEGARKVVLTRDHFYNDGRISYKAGTRGVVIPIWDGAMQHLFREINEFFEDYEWWKKSKSRCRTDRVYDFFPLYQNRKTGKIQISQYHSHISRFDFMYCEFKMKEFDNPQLKLFDL